MLAAGMDMISEGNGDEMEAHILQSVHEMADSTQAAVDKLHKRFHSVVSKGTKTLERQFKTDPADLDVELDTDLMNSVIADHMIQEAPDGVLDEFCRESGIAVDRATRRNFQVMNTIIAAIRRGDYAPLEHWILENRGALAVRDSTLEFLHRKLQFIELARAGAVDDARRFARQHFPQALIGLSETTSATLLDDIKLHLGSLVFLNELDAFPRYRQLYAVDARHALEQAFKTALGELSGLAPESALSVLTQAGMEVAGQLSHATAFIDGPWYLQKALDTALDVPDRFTHHSIIICPVTKEPTSPANPPVRLKCGHVISRGAAQSLASSSRGRVFKCPTCPMQLKIDEVVQLNI